MAHHGQLSDEISSCEMRMLRYYLEISLEKERRIEEIRKEASKRVTDTRCDEKEKNRVVWPCMPLGE